MNNLNHKSRTQTRKKVEPSTRDSISTWLDVLTAMLVMPESQRVQVRDELEDHLRSRVDDLLIVGKPEPEAIQIAVAELGETAELAKLITHAHTRINPRRKIMNAAMITVALAGMSFGGFTFINGTGAPSATPSNGGAVPVVIPSENNREDDIHAVDIQDLKLVPALAKVAEAFDLSLSVGDGVKVRFQQSNMYFEKFTVQGEMTLAEMIKKIQRSSEASLLDYVIEYDESEISVFTQDELLRSTIEIRVSPMPDWIGQEYQRENYTESIRDILRVKNDFEFASIQIVGSSVVIAAPPEIHLEIDKIVQGMKNAEDRASVDRAHRTAAYEIKTKAKNDARAEEQQLRRQRTADEKKAERLQAIERIQVEFDRVRMELIQKKSMMKELEFRLGEMRNGSNPEQRRLSSKVHSKEIAELEKTLIDTVLLHEEYQSRYEYLRDTMIESQYAELFKGLE